MKPTSSQLWDFIAENVLALCTVAAGLGVAVWQIIAKPGSLDPVSVAILGLLTLIATSELVERRRGLKRLQVRCDGILDLLVNLPSAHVKRFPDSTTAIVYLAKRAREAQVSIDQASIDRRRSTYPKPHDQFDTVKSSLIKTGKVEYRYLFGVDGRRTANVIRWLTNSKGRFVAAGLCTFGDPAGVVSFTVFDRREVFVRNPYCIGQSAVYLSIRQPDVVAMFMAWYEYLWHEAEKIDPNLPPDRQRELLDRLLRRAEVSDAATNETSQRGENKGMEHDR